MALNPKIEQVRPSFFLKKCQKCGENLPPESFIRVRSELFPDGYAGICIDCLNNIIKEQNDNWKAIDRICQWLDIPFVPNEVEKIHQTAGERWFMVYSQIFLEQEYDDFGWDIYHQKFVELRDGGHLEDELPLLKEQKLEELRSKWGANYDEEELGYLERLYDGILMTQNVSGALQIDQAKKLCKISLEVDSRIREGGDFDKMLSSYDKLVKTAEFTPKNAKNASDFDSVGELCRWLEKRGWVNKFYDGVTQDIVDETIKNIQAYNRSLYTNESGIGEEINRRIEALKSAKEMENTYTDFNQEYDMDKYEVDGYDELMNEDFEAGGDFDVGV